MNKENLQKQIEEMKNKLADMEAELNKPEVVINYWQPKEGNMYYDVTNLGSVGSSCYAQNYHKDKVRYRVFKTRKEAEKYAEYVKAEETLRRVIAEANEGWLPDWHGKEAKYVIGFVFKPKYIKVLSYVEDKVFPNFMYIKSRELAEKLMLQYDEEFVTYLSY